MSKTELVCVRHMFDAAEEILQFSSGKSRSDLTKKECIIFYVFYQFYW